MLQKSRRYLLLAFFTHGAFGQWVNYPTQEHLGRGRQPALSPTMSRASGGKPDLSGVWRTKAEHRNRGTAKNTEAVWREVLLDSERMELLDRLYDVPLHH